MRIMCIGAHPDDCEASPGGTAVLWRERGDDVHLVSVTDGRSGHYYDEYIQNPQVLIDRRLAESAAAAKVIGASWANLGAPDGALYVNQEMTEKVIREIRRFQPDLVVTNRPVDYHRDHRYTAQLVVDATYMLTVPTVCPDVPSLRKMPTFCYWHDGFTEPTAFRPDKVVAIDRAMEKKASMCVAHESQFFEWLPYNAGNLDQVPATAEERYSWFLHGWLERRGAGTLESCAKLTSAKLPDCKFAEAFQLCEYGSRPSPEELDKLFP
jgi:LmbE family N-acetylglucosaminyl deacetylase